MPDFSKQLSKYMPEEAAPIVSSWINQTRCQFKVAKVRKTKFGDYQAPFQGQPHKISVNHDLNPYAFLVTTVHEFAHLKTWTEHKNRVRPHGLEWKKNFKELLAPFLGLNIFPEAMKTALQHYLQNPSASSCTDLNLYRALKRFDKQLPHKSTVESLRTGTEFQLDDGRHFRLIEKRRTRYSCQEIPSGKIYLFHAVAEVIPIEITHPVTKPNLF